MLKDNGRQEPSLGGDPIGYWSQQQHLEQGFLKALDAIRGGQPLAAPLNATGVFPHQWSSR